MTKIYAVMERQFEYNDEGYDISEGGNVQVAFSTMEEAQAEVNKRMLNMFRSGRAYMYEGNYSHWLEDTDELIKLLEDLSFNEDQISNIINGHYHETGQFLDSLKTSTDEQIMVVVDSLINPAYYIEEVEYNG